MKVFPSFVFVEKKRVFGFFPGEKIKNFKKKKKPKNFLGKFKKVINKNFLGDLPWMGKWLPIER